MKEEYIDSQFIAENVGFLDNCFDNTFVLQSSLVTVQEYVAKEINTSFKEPTLIKKKPKALLQDQSSILDNTCRKVSLTQCSDKNGFLQKDLKSWGLPPEIANKYKEKGIVQMFDWQVQCLAKPKVLLDCCNLVYSAPTSAGKTLVAEIITIKTVLERQKKVIIILPFVSIVREKMFYLQDIFSTSGVRVEGFVGSQTPPGGLQAVHVAICTIEKANSLINHLLDDGNISDLGAVIVDELHLLGDPHRGYILELLLTKIKYITAKEESIKIQIVGMSATLPNLEVLADWLEAELFVTNFRPIPLDEYCLVGNKYFDKDGKCIGLVPDFKSKDLDKDNVLKICLSTIKEGCSVLIFCMTKNRCESLAQSLASSFYNLGCSGKDVGLVLRQQLKSEPISEVLEQLQNCPVGLDKVLKNTISFGVAYHHAGLTFDERDIIEAGFKSGALRVLVATSTLSSGVNLPARKVIIRTPVFQRQPINILTYKQMIGRAGRMGKDSKGESVLICTETEKNIGFDLMMGALDPVHSCIARDDKYMRAILEMIASQDVCTKMDLETYSKCTLLYAQTQENNVGNDLVMTTVENLIKFELVRKQDDNGEVQYVATHLGKACLSSSMAPNDGISLFCELQKARQCLVLETDLHLIYLVTPYSVSSQWADIDWLHLLTLWESMTNAMKKVGELVGVQESFIIRCLRGGIKSNTAANKLNVHKRFYTALALQDLVNEVPLADVALKFQCARGFLQSLQQAAATFAGMVTAFCRQLGWKNMEMLISQFQDRLHFGIHSELLELLKIPSLNGKRARALYDLGFETIFSIASADINAIENALHKAIPFQSEKERDDDDSDDIRKRNKIKNIWITGFCGMTTKEAAHNLILEARKYLEYELGSTEVKWRYDLPEKLQSNANVANVTVKEESVIENEVNHIYVKEERLVETEEERINVEQELGIVAEENPIFVKEEHVIETIEEQASQELFYDNIDQNNKTVSYNTQKNNNSSNLLNDMESFGKNKGECESKVDDKSIMKKLKSNSIIQVSLKEGPCSLIENDKTEISCTMTKKPEAVNVLAAKQNEIDDWDSLNYTEGVIQNITKSRVSDNIFSPNISLFDPNEFENASAKHNTAKDVSLFSSEGDSMFEESLPLELIPSKLLDGKENRSVDQTHVSEVIQISDLSNNDEMKLIFEDDRNSENELEKGFNLSEDINEIFSQNNDTVTLKNSFVGPFKRSASSNLDKIASPAKKTKVSSTAKSIKAPFISEPSHILVKHNEFHCRVLRDNNLLDQLDLICSITEAAIFLCCEKKSVHLSGQIGRDIFGSAFGSNSAKVNTCAVKCMAVYTLNNTCFVLDIDSDFNNPVLKDKLSKWLKNSSVKLKILSMRNIFLSLMRWLDIEFTNCEDIFKIDWLYDSEVKLPNIYYLMNKYCGIKLLSEPIIVDKKVKTLQKLNYIEEACLKAWCIWMVADKLYAKIQERSSVIFRIMEVEFHVERILSLSEYYGLAVDKALASKLLTDAKSSQQTLQKKAYKICGKHFNFNSSKEVAKVLGMYKGKKVSMHKRVLTAHSSPIASIIIYWRKLNSILTNTLYPLTEKAHNYSQNDRINPEYNMYTCTGRISMQEPNLQNVPRTFSIPYKYLSPNDNEPSADVVEFNCRNIFKATDGCVLVSADYCQLEMRILTHYSGDVALTRIMKTNEDVFKSIASTWSAVPEDQVDDDLRQKAKQLCYGIIYGMGNKTLSQHLDVTEAEANMFTETFYHKFPKVREFTKNVVEQCRRRGYVETLMARRRFLPDIESNLELKKSAAERKAINTTIQGSAADIAKAAMCAIDNITKDTPYKPRLILQMHDELIYEVPEENKSHFIQILKSAMEGTVQLNVPLPVKVKSGLTWGSMADVQF